MATRVVVSVEQQQLIDQAKAVQTANREGQLNRELDKRVEQKIVHAYYEALNLDGDNKEPELDLDSRPAAHRNLDDLICPVESLITTEDGTRYLNVRYASTGEFVRIELASTDMPNISTQINRDVFGGYTPLGKVRIEQIAHSTNGVWSYTWRTGNFYSTINSIGDLHGFAEQALLPLTTTSYYDRSTGQEFHNDVSQELVLPINETSAIYIYLHNEITHQVYYDRNETNVRTSSNERVQFGTYSAPSNFPITNTTSHYFYEGWWDTTTNYHTDYVYTGTAKNQAYTAYGVLVTDQGSREITLPAALVTALEEIYPQADTTGQVSIYATIEYDAYDTYDGGPYLDESSANYTTTSQQVAGFDSTVWQNAGRYGAHPSSDKALALHYGLGELDSTNHYGNFSTPAIYWYINGVNDLSDSYDEMRVYLDMEPPQRFYAPCARSNSCPVTEVKQFDRSLVVPTTTTTAIPPSKFVRNKNTDVEIGAPAGSIIYAWNWGDEELCRLKLLELGFAVEDLVL